MMAAKMLDSFHGLGLDAFEEMGRCVAPAISPFEGEMSPKVTEGDGYLSARPIAAIAFQDTPLCPAGHLPHKGGDRQGAAIGGFI